MESAQASAWHLVGTEQVLVSIFVIHVPTFHFNIIKQNKTQSSDNKVNFQNS